MNTLQTVVLIAHTFIAVMIIVLVLLQRGKGADAGAAFGAGASGTVFGARGSTSFFSRATAVLATAFFVSSLTLAYISSQHSTAPKSLIEGAPAVETEQQQDSGDESMQDLPQLEDSVEAPAAGDMPSLQSDDPGEEQDPDGDPEQSTPE